MAGLSTSSPKTRVRIPNGTRLTSLFASLPFAGRSHTFDAYRRSGARASRHAGPGRAHRSAGLEPAFQSRPRFRQVSYAVSDQQHPATSTRLKHAAESSLKHPEHDHVKREPGGASPDERKLQNNFRTGAVAAQTPSMFAPVSLRRSPSATPAPRWVPCWKPSNMRIDRKST